MAVDIRARAREVLRAELANGIVQVFIDRGYDDVSVDEAATAVGISRATFFRYFASKEDVIVVGVELNQPEYAAALRDVPSGVHTAWELARLALTPTLTDAANDAAHRRERLRLIAGQPSLHARFIQRRQRLIIELADALEAHSTDRQHADVVAAAAMAALDVAWTAWASSDDMNLEDAVDAVFVHLANSGRREEQ